MKITRETHCTERSSVFVCLFVSFIGVKLIYNAVTFSGAAKVIRL